MQCGFIINLENFFFIPPAISRYPEEAKAQPISLDVHHATQVFSRSYLPLNC